MFAQRIRQIGLVVAAAALAIVATSFVPAVSTFAAPLAPSQEDAMVGKPDVAVNITNVNANSDLSWDILYSVSNVGTVASGPIAVKVECGDADYHFAVRSA